MKPPKNIYMPKYIYILCTLFIWTYIFIIENNTSAQETMITGNSLQSLSVNSAQPVDIESDKMEIFERKGEVIFTGNVRAKRGQVILSGEKMIVFYDTSTNTTENTPQNLKILHINVEDNTQMTVGKQNIKSKWAKMNIAENNIIFGGGVDMTNGQVTLKGKELHVNLTNGDTLLIGDRVRGKFTPENIGGKEK